jgi:hypothetical protein
MTSLPSSSRSSWSPNPLLLLFATVPLLLALACADKHIGRPCLIGLPAGDPNIAAVNPQALECPSRLCLLPAQETTLDSTKTPTGALCTDYCTSDDDCADGEKRGNDKNSTRCITGFSCRTPIANLESNPLSCKRVCVCRDFLNVQEPETRPKSCP